MYVLDEPENAHSPIIMSYPGATILSFDDEKIEPVEYEETEHHEILAMRKLINARDTLVQMIKHIDDLVTPG